MICAQPLDIAFTTPSMSPSAFISESSVNIAVVMGIARKEYGSVYQRRA